MTPGPETSAGQAAAAPLLEAARRWSGGATRILLAGAASALPAAELADCLQGEVHRAADPGQLDLPEAACDLVLLADFPERLRWPRWALQEVGRVLAPGGRLVLTAVTPGLRGRLAPSGSRLDRLLRRLGWPARGIRPAHLRRLLEQLGYVLENELPGAGGRRLLLARRRDEADSDRRWLHAALAPTTADRRRRQERERGLARWLAAHPELDANAGRSTEAQILSAGSALVIAPHPDDELVGCGGTLLRLRQADVRIAIELLTDGSATAALRDLPADRRAQVRLEEAARVAAALGAELNCWSEPDGRLHPRHALVARLAGRLAALRPELIFAPPPHDPHPDHAAAAALLAAALASAELSPSPRVACYEVWTLVPANALVDIEPVLAEKARLLMAHRHGMMVVDYIRESRLVERGHAEHWHGRPGFLEAFFVLDAARFVALAGGQRMKSPSPALR